MIKEKKDHSGSVSWGENKPDVVGCAFDVVKKLGQKYKIADGVCYLVDEEYHESDKYSPNDYCYKCASKIAKKEGLKVEYESSPEKEDFCLCDSCGKILQAAILWTEQEMEHWLTYLRKEDLKNKRCCYELMEIFDPIYGAYEKFPNEVEKIAHRVMSLA